jgi:hypothetical protein
MGIALAGIGGVLMLIGAIWIIVIAFQNNDILWGVLSFLCFIVFFVYAFQHLAQTKTALILYAIGFVLSVIGQVAGAGALLGGG